MRRILLGLTAIALLSPGLVAEDNSPLDTVTTVRLPSVLPTCSIETVIARLARTSHVSIGLEPTSDCAGKWQPFNVFPSDNSDLNPMTVRQLLNQIVVRMPEYRWAEMNGIAVVRPVDSWTDPSDALNLGVAPFRANDVTALQALAILLRVPYSHNGLDNRINNRLFSIDFKGGTVLDALNALVHARQGVGWNATVRPDPSAINDQVSLSIRTFNMGSRDEGEGAISMGIPVARLPLLARR